jgi:hypothetical protein
MSSKKMNRSITLAGAFTAGALAVVALSAPMSRAAGPVAASPPGSTVVLSEDGAWSWFSDPRAICVDGGVTACWVRSDGVLQVGQWRAGVDGVEVFDLAYGLAPDDHNCPALIQTSDGRLTAFYAGHALRGTHIMSRTTLLPGRIGGWGPAEPIPANTPGSGGVTYANPLKVPGFRDRAYVCFRGGSWRPTFVMGQYRSEDMRWRWSAAGTLINVPRGRPYVKYRPFQDELIGIAFTDGHPRDTDNNVYFIAIRPDSIGLPVYVSADGSVVADERRGTISSSGADVVYDRERNPDTPGDDSWVWDVAFSDDGEPVVLYSTFTSRTSHMYHYARHTESGWESHVLLNDAGASFADTTIWYPQYYYSGGMSLDPNDPSVVYLSRANDVGGWDIERWSTADGGDTWTSEAITSGATEDNARPFVPWGCPPEKEIVLWMSGRYDFYKSPLETIPEENAGRRFFDTSILMWSRDREEPGGKG